MRKREELTSPESCMSRAREAEMTFVLLGRDDAQITEALACAEAMARERAC
jgi:hypothetical protein